MKTYGIKVWCEYDISSDFGLNNDQVVLTDVKDLPSDKVDECVLKLIQEHRPEVSMDDQGTLWDWEQVTIRDIFDFA